MKAIANIPPNALSLLIMLLYGRLVPAKLPSSLTAALDSPRLVVKTFRHTLRGGISADYVL